MNYGLMSYGHTLNLGNEIQSIASRQFLPEIDYYIDHEKINLFKSPDRVKMILNGYFLDCAKAWPPSKDIEPLLISMHFTTSITERRDAILTKESKEFFKSYGPVGCRDLSTVDFLKENDIDAYFSGCLTLTLDSGKKDELDEKYLQEPYILVVTDMNDQIINFLKDKTDKKIYPIEAETIPDLEKAYYPNTDTLYNFTSFYTAEEKFFMAENMLRLYENADSVITDRLHCQLPCIALKTPVLHLNDRSGRERFNGLNQLFNECSFDEYLNNYEIFDVNNPPKNSDKYLKIRKDLIDKCKGFTSYKSSSYKSDLSDEDIIRDYTLLISKNNHNVRRYILHNMGKTKSLLSDINKIKSNNEKLTNKNKSIQKENEKLKEEIQLLKQRKAIKIADSFNNFKNKF